MIRSHPSSSIGSEDEARRKEDQMRRGIGIAVLLLAILAGIAIGVGAYHAGVSHGLAEAASGGRVVRVVGPGYGFFPFGLFLFPLFLFAIFALFRFAWWGRRWGGGYGPGPGHGHDHGPGPWGEGWRRAEDWHRRQHEQDSGDHPPAGGEPASV
jgi:hypothetical protein